MTNYRKLLWLIISLGILIGTVYFDDIKIFWQSKEEKRLSVPILGMEQIQDLCRNREDLETDIKLYYDGYEIPYDYQTKTFYIPQKLGDDSGWEGRIKAQNGRLYWMQDVYWGKKAEAIREGHAFEIYHVIQNTYSVYKILFTGMPIVSLSTERVEENADGEMLNYGRVRVFDQYRSAAHFQSAECSFHIRGGTSKGYPKSSYKVELEKEKLSFLGLREDDDWILNSLYDDAGLIHNKISYQVWREIAAYNEVANDDGTAMEYAEFFLDNEYLGVYGILERIDGKELSLGNKDIMYKCRSTRVPEEYNYTNDDTDGLPPIFVMKYPDQYCEEDWNAIKRWVNYFLKGKLASYQEGEMLLNMENAIDSNLFCLLINGSDNTRKNNFFVAEYQDNGSYQFKKIPWDLNATWGNPWVDLEECNYTLYDVDAFQSVDTWITDISTLYYYDEIKVSELLYKRWVELRRNGVITAEKICGMLDEQFEYLYNSGAYKHNYDRWPDGQVYWKDEYIYEYVNKRIEFLDSYFAQLYMDAVSPAIYGGTDYSAEFEARYYWEENYETLSELYTYDKQVLLEHYVLYGKPFGLKGRRQNNSYSEYTEAGE